MIALLFCGKNPNDIMAMQQVLCCLFLLAMTHCDIVEKGLGFGGRGIVVLLTAVQITEEEERRHVNE